MRNNILTLLVGFVVMLGSLMLFKLGLDKMTDANAAQSESLTRLDVDLDRRAILYRVQPGDTLWSLAERFYGSGRSWQQIAHANSIPEGEGLTAGAIIRIPLKKETVEMVKHPEAQTLSYDEVAPPGLDNRFAIDDSALGVALCRLDGDRFPAGALCVARITEDERIRLNIFDATSGDSAPVAIYEAPKGNHLRELRAEDINGDGTQELYTIWETESDNCTSRVFRWHNGDLELVRETPNDPLALLRLRAQNDR
jgi:hypothetical protein